MVFLNRLKGFEIKMVADWYESIKEILKDEPELWLAYLHGQQLENIKHLSESKPRYRGLMIQLLKFLYILIRSWRPFNSFDKSTVGSYFVFAGSSNQMDSLDSTVDALKDKGAVVTAIAPKVLLNRQERKDRYVSLTFSTTDILKAVFLVIKRGPFLYKQLKELHPKAVNWWFASFCLIYVYLAYFQRVLSAGKPLFVLTSNDHNVPNRCMLAAAHQLGIKTVYLQHASVSKLFPALRVNYAFLDGQCALDTYSECEKNQPNTARQVPIPKIFLSGQKKPLMRADKQKIDTVGIALNSLDSIDVAISFIRQLADIDYKIIVRWHPGQAEADVKKIRDSFAADNRVNLSEPKQQPVSHFLSSISWLVAGNSSIHLEAAISGVSTIYYELTPASTPDYYGYVKNGLAIKASSADEINILIKRNVEMSSDSKEFVRYYSSTYQTEWEGREGELVAECLEALKGAKLLPINAVAF